MQQDMQQRQQQIRKLHKKIKEYRLTPAETHLFERNKYDLYCSIENKFVNSRINAQYKFPILVEPQEQNEVDDIGLAYDLVTQNERRNVLAISRSANAANIGSAHDTKRIKNKEIYASTFIDLDDEGSKKTAKIRLTTDFKERYSQFEIQESEPPALQLPVSNKLNTSLKRLNYESVQKYNSSNSKQKENRFKISKENPIRKIVLVKPDKENKNALIKLADRAPLNPVVSRSSNKNQFNCGKYESLKNCRVQLDSLSTDSKSTASKITIKHKGLQITRPSRSPMNRYLVNLESSSHNFRFPINLCSPVAKQEKRFKTFTNR